METETFDLLLLDLNMPNMSGLELLTHIREFDSPNRNVQTIIISAEGRQQLKDDLARFGVSIFVNKPMTTEMLWTALQTAVQEMTDARPRNSGELPVRNWKSYLAFGFHLGDITIRRLAWTSASPTGSGPEGSSPNEFHSGRVSLFSITRLGFLLRTSD